MMMKYYFYVLFILLFSFNSYAQEIYDATVDENEILTPNPGDDPKINGPDVYGVGPSRDFVYRIPTTGKRPFIYYCEDLPMSMVLDREKGILFGKTPYEKGKYPLTLVAMNDHGVDTAILTLVVGDTLALTPPMGWNHWQTYYHFISDDIIRQSADAMVEKGLADAGYQYVTIDDCWMRITPELAEQTANSQKTTASKGLDIEAKSGPVRDKNGVIIPAKDFPDMKALTDYIHSNGLKAGIYSSPGKLTCQKFEGSYGHELIDAKTYAEWGFDLLKYDWCSYKEIDDIMMGDAIENRSIPYKFMGGAIAQQNRDIVLSACEYGYQPWIWGNEAGWQYWRIGGDLAHTINEVGVYEISKKALELGKYSGPGSWNDPDFLLIGNWVSPFEKDAEPNNYGMTTNEAYSFFSLWCMMACPLIASVELTSLDDFCTNIYTNTEMIDVNQDILGKCAEVVVMNDKEWVLKKQMNDGSVILGIYDIGNMEHDVIVPFKSLGLKGEFKARDLWRYKDIGVYKKTFTAKVSPHGCAIFKLTKVD